MCEHMKVSRNAYYTWRRARDSSKESCSKREGLESMIGDIFEDSRRNYGSPRIAKELEKQGHSVSRAYIGRLMKGMGLRSRLSKKFVCTTDSKHEYPIAPNTLNREFGVDKLGKVWVSDITYIRLSDKWAYLTTMIDLADRAVVGWSLSTDMTADSTVICAWLNARKNRRIEEGFILHSDRGVQYAASSTRAIFGFNSMASQSMSRKGNCWDNAVAESFFKTIKYEELNHYTFNSFEQLYQSIEGYINWYNTKRIHSTLGYQTPLERELSIRNKYRKAA